MKTVTLTVTTPGTHRAGAPEVTKGRHPHGAHRQVLARGARPQAKRNPIDKPPPPPQ